MGRRVTGSALSVVEADIEAPRASVALPAVGTGSTRPGVCVADGLSRLLTTTGVTPEIAGIALAIDALVETPRSIHALIVSGACAAREVGRVADRRSRVLVTSRVPLGITGSAEAVDALLPAEAGAISVADTLDTNAGDPVLIADGPGEHAGAVVAAAAFAIGAVIAGFAAGHVAAFALRVRIGGRAFEIATELVDAAAGMVVAGIAELAATVDTLVLVAGSIHALGVVGAGAALPGRVITDRRRGPAGHVGGRKAAFAASGLKIAGQAVALAVVLTGAAGHHRSILGAPWRVSGAAVVAVGLTGLASSVHAEIQVPRPREATRVIDARDALVRLGVADRGI